MEDDSFRVLILPKIVDMDVLSFEEHAKLVSDFGNLQHIPIC